MTSNAPSPTDSPAQKSAQAPNQPPPLPVKGQDSHGRSYYDLTYEERQAAAKLDYRARRTYDRICWVEPGNRD